MNYLKLDDLRELLQKKIRAVSASNKYLVRRLTADEAQAIERLDDWQQGYFHGFDGSQIVMETRPDGTSVLFRI